MLSALKLPSDIQLQELALQAAELDTAARIAFDHEDTDFAVLLQSRAESLRSQIVQMSAEIH